MGIYYKEFEKHLNGEKKYLTDENCLKINKFIDNVNFPYFGIKGFTWDDSFCIVESQDNMFEFFWAEKGSAENVQEISNIYDAINCVCVFCDNANINPEIVKEYLYETLKLDKEKIKTKRFNN